MRQLPQISIAMLLPTICAAIATVLAFVPLTLTCTILIFTAVHYLIGLFLTSKYGEPIEFLSGPDTFMAVNAAGDPPLINGYSILKGELDIAVLRKRVEKNWLRPRNPDGSYKYKKLRSVLHRDMGYYFWLKNNDFRIEDCVYVHQGVKPKNDQEFHCMLEELINTPFKRNSSPWQIILIPLSNNFSTLGPGIYNALFLRCQHYLCDGISIMRMVSASLDEPYDQTPIPPKRFLSPLHLVRYGLNMLIVAPLMLIGATFAREDHILSLEGKLTYKYLAGFTSYISTARFKGLKNALGCTVNDVVMASVTGALRAHFLAEGAFVPDYVTMMVPISKHDLSKPVAFCNNITVAPYMCPVKAKTPLERIQAIKKESETLKKSPLIDYFFFFFVSGLYSCVPVWILSSFSNQIKFTGVVSSLPSPQKDIPCLGNPVLRLGCLGPVQGTAAGISVAAATNFYGLQFGVKVDRAIFKEQSIVERFLKFIVAEFEELERSAPALSTHIFKSQE